MSGRTRRGIGKGWTVAELARANGVASILEGPTMPARKKREVPKRTKIIVEKAGLVGADWENRKVSGSVYLMPDRLCHDLTYWLTRRIATLIGPAKPNGEGWQHLCCWPGRGMFVVKIRLEEVQ